MTESQANDGSCSPVPTDPLTDDPVLVDRRGAVGIVTLNRPRVLNAINREMIELVWAALDGFDRDDGVKAVVLTGSGDRAFSAGADIRETADERAGTPPHLSDRWHEWNWYVATYRKPTVGALNGLTYGGAAQLALTFDLRIGCDKTSFRFLYAAIGQIVGTWILPHVVGWSRAKELLLTARLVEADEALRLGLVSQIVPSERLLEAAIEIAEGIARNHPGSVQGIKALLNEQIGMDLLGGYQNEQAARATRFPPVPFTEAFREFLDRPPGKSEKGGPDQ